MEQDVIVMKTIDGTIMTGEFCEEMPDSLGVKNVKIVNKTGIPIPNAETPEKRYEGLIYIMKRQIIWWYKNK